ncbi:MAG: L-serine ammonia-lyase, iron-sulfur-dependent, subunit alpha [Roseburia sp.]|nr:L-serine ammonia-lyase, iron-sulfur-dependent, subunit alpha [Anaeroplasma bactoclasticum]MCM1196980.1 L-serine ammonia-lyase, iron-sulfur-dependent, subunit alpha [Roseburia sp.]MCM1557850.1 L-serine ammonia-lyase, iron-sulfur-dependent, subunit alpha [Anaeroplasma bactoclasticum]
MHSIKELFKIGNGPSSSHTIGPLEASKEFLKRFPSVDEVKVVLYGSLALTGRGHLTDYIIEKTLLPIPCHIEFDINTKMAHPNTMVFYGYKNGELMGSLKVYSIGGGAIQIAGEKERVLDKVYKLNTYKAISEYCKKEEISLSEYVDFVEGKKINSYMELIYDTMLNSIEKGLKHTGVLPGKLQVKRKAAYIYQQNSKAEGLELLRKKVIAYAYAVSEENASGGKIVTAPTCGASGVLPACLKYAIDLNCYTKEELLNGLKVSGLIGNIVKTNGSISGAEAGCQAEVGTACAMAAAFLCYLDGGSVDMIERASEIALEHHLGLTCDPIDGYVQIPCIERNAVAALRAIDAAKLASYLNSNESKISFDLVVATMLKTGHDLRTNYRETSEGGLAKTFYE